MMQSFPTDYNGIKSKIINRKASSMSPNVWQPNNTISLSYQGQKKKNQREIKEYFEMN